MKYYSSSYYYFSYHFRYYIRNQVRKKYIICCSNRSENLQLKLVIKENQFPKRGKSYHYFQSMELFASIQPPNFCYNQKHTVFCINSMIFSVYVTKTISQKKHCFFPSLRQCDFMSQQKFKKLMKKVQTFFFFKCAPIIQPIPYESKST